MTRNRRSAKTAGAKWELAVARFFDSQTPCRVSRRQRTQPDTGDIEGLYFAVGTKRITIVVECKNTIPMTYQHGKPVRKKDGSIRYTADFAGQWHETMAETKNKEKLDNCIAIGILAKKIPGLGMGMPYIRQQPVIMTDEDAQMIGLDIGNGHTHECDPNMSYWDVAEQVGRRCVMAYECFKWHWRGSKKPLIITTLDVVSDAIAHSYGGAR